MARPKIEFDIDDVQRLAGLGLTDAEVATALGVHPITVWRNKKRSDEFSNALKKGRIKAASEVANAIYQAAISGNIAAAIWYEKTRRGLVEPKAQEPQNETTIRIVDESTAGRDIEYSRNGHREPCN